MRKIFFLLLLLPYFSFAQKWHFEGIYRIPPEKKHVNARDTFNEEYIFTFDSFKHSYTVVEPGGRRETNYIHYGTWKIFNEEILEEPDRKTKVKHSFNRMHASFDEGKMNGYFERTNAAYADFSPGRSTSLCFIKDDKIFIFDGQATHPLIK